MPPHNSGGLGVACYQLCKALAQNGADIEFILPYYADDPFPFMKVSSANTASVVKNKANSNPYHSANYRKGHLDGGVFAEQVAYEKYVANVAESRQFDIIHAHDWLTFRAAIRAKQIQNIPLVLHIHSIEKDRAGGHIGNPLVREIEYTSMLITDRVITVSEHTKNLVINEYDIPADKIEVIHNSIDLNDFKAVSGDNVYKYLEAMKKHGWRVVVNVGRLTVQKGLPNLLRSARLVIDKQPKTFFLFVGSGEQRDELIDLAAGLGIADKVFFTGFLRGKAWSDAYRVADLFVMPSVSEPFGLTPLEAVGYGTPALVSKQSGVSEVLKNCLKVDYWDINEMANQIASVVGNDALRDTLYASAYDELSKLSWQGAANRLMDMYTFDKAGVLK